MGPHDLTNHLRKLWQNTIDPCPCRGHSTTPTPYVDSYQNADLCASFERPAGRIPASMHCTPQRQIDTRLPVPNPIPAQRCTALQGPEIRRLLGCVTRLWVWWRVTQPMKKVFLDSVLQMRPRMLFFSGLIVAAARTEVTDPFPDRDSQE